MNIQNLTNKKIFLAGEQRTCELFAERCKGVLEIMGSLKNGEKGFLELQDRNTQHKWYKAARQADVREIMTTEDFLIIVCMPNAYYEHPVYKLLTNYGMTYGENYIDYYIILREMSREIRNKLNSAAQIVIWGTKYWGNFIYDNLCRNYKIDAFTDSDHSSFSRDGIPYTEEAELKQKFPNAVILVASTYYGDIKEKLVKKGYREFTDFWPACMYEPKKLLLFYGTCQTMSPIRCLRERSNLFQLYIVRQYHMIADLHPAIQEKWNYCLNKCDVIIYNNGGISSDKIIQLNEYIKKLQPDAVTIAIPSYEFKGQLMQATTSFDHDTLHFRWEKGNAAHSYWFINDKYIREYMKKGLTLNEIKSIITKEDFLDQQTIEHNLKLELRKVEIQDEISDIKIYPFVRDNCKKELLFADGTHFMPSLIWEISSQLIQILQLKDVSTTELKNAFMKQKVVSLPIYPAVRKVLTLPETVQYEKRVDFEGDRNFIYEEWNFEQYVESCFEYNMLVQKLKDTGVILG